MPRTQVGRNLHGEGVSTQPDGDNFQQEARADMARAFRDVYETREGRIVLDHIIHEMCHHDNLLVHPDPNVVLCRVAQHDVGTKIQRLVTGIIPTSEVKVKHDARS